MAAAASTWGTRAATAAPLCRALGCSLAALGSSSSSSSSGVSSSSLAGLAACSTLLRHASTSAYSTAAATSPSAACFGGAGAAADSGDAGAPVVIAGGGPTGLTTALLLAKLGVRSVVLERSRTLTDHPQAHLINMRCMEILRSFGDPDVASRVVQRMPPLQQWRRFVYCTGIGGGDILGMVDHFKGQISPYQPAISPEPVAHLAQHRLLPLLVDAVKQQPAIDLRMGHSIRSFSQTPEGISAVVDESPDGAGGGGALYRLGGRYLVAADGARGGLRQQLGIGMGGPGAIQHLINIHFISPQLGRQLKSQGREGMLYFVFNRDAIAVVVAHNLDEGEFVAQVPYFPPLQSGADFTPTRCAELVRQVAKRSDLELEVRTIRPWTMAGRVAHTYRSGNVFLVGDAAHAFPPSGAFGMNTGVCDAHNLAWKLAAVLQGRAGPGLLDTYTEERKPVGTSNMLLSVANFNEALKVPQILGLDYKAANLLSDVLAAPVLSWVPPDLRKGVLETTMSVGKAAASPIRRLRQSELAAVFDHGETLRLQFPKEDLGFIYASGAVCHGPGDAAAVAEYQRPKPRDAPYTPTTLVGARLPHVAIRVLHPGSLLAQGGSHEVASTIDLPAAAGTSLLLLLSESQQQEAWVQAAAASAAATGVPVHPAVITQSTTATAAAAAASSSTGSAAVTVVQDRDGSWLHLRSLEPEGALLVRPDGHIAWRHSGQPGSQLAAELERAVRKVMSK